MTYGQTEVARGLHQVLHDSRRDAHAAELRQDADPGDLPLLPVPRADDMQAARARRDAIDEPEGMDRGRVVAVALLRAVDALLLREDGGADRVAGGTIRRGIGPANGRSQPSAPALVDIAAITGAPCIGWPF